MSRLYTLSAVEKRLEKEKQRRKKSAKSNNPDNPEKLKPYEYLLIIGMILILYMFTAASCAIS